MKQNFTKKEIKALKELAKERIWQNELIKFDGEGRKIMVKQLKGG